MNVLLSVFFALLSGTLLAREADDNLSWKLAQARRAQIEEVHYRPSFELTKGSESYRGEVEIELKLAHMKSDLSMDFHTQQITKLEINGKEVKKYPKRRGSFDLPKEFLAAKTVVRIAYSNTFSKESSGFQRSVDPQDGGEYLFTDFEPYYAHWLFPCFDQPDLKARYSVTVRAPQEWTIIHNEPVASAKAEGELKTTTFKTTPLMSPYLFFLGAGPYQEWRDDYQGLPLVIYARKTLAPFMDADRIFATTKKGLAFFNEYFGTPYPYSQYGHVFIPEFAWGGMENPGAVAMNERNIYRGAVTKSRLEGRDSLILHEMAHMWFGDLVTMEWWNDLWLNESFATYLASIAQDRVMKAESTWMSFLSTKTWGYWQDQLVTTHPIETAVPDTRTTKGNFDGITYAKGASALKQLHFFVGEDGFKKGLQAYFKTFAFKNTRREDFIDAIAKASGKDLSAWTKMWLQTAGPHRVKIDAQCEKDKVTLKVTQSPNKSGAHSPHRTRVGLFRFDGSKAELLAAPEIEYSGATASMETGDKGVACPDFVMPNLDDMDYALFALDQNSLRYATQAMKTLPRPIDRYGVWAMLGQMVRDRELTPRAFITAGIEAIAQEEDEMLLGLIASTRGSLYSQYRIYLTKDERAELAPAFEQVVWDRLQRAPKGSGLALTFFDFYINMVQTPEGLKRLSEFLQKNEAPRGLKLDPDRRWQIVSTLAAQNFPGAQELIAAEEKSDPSTLGKRNAFAARVSIPERANKERAWKELFTSKELTFSTLRQAGGRLNNTNFPELAEAFVDPFFKEVRRRDWKTSDDQAELFFESYFPAALCSEQLLERSRREFKGVKHSSLLRRSWLEANDELERCVEVRKYSRRKLL